MNEYSDTDDRKKQDFDDLQHEIAGINTGRSKRFLASGGRNSSSQKEREARRYASTAFDLLMLDPEYAITYERAQNSLSNAETETATALEAAVQVLNEATTTFDDIQENATQLPDGTRVYMDEKTGKVFTEDGTRLDDATAAGIMFKGNEPTYGEFLTAKERITDAQRYVDDWYGYQVTLGGFRNELDDTKHPPSRERLLEIERKIEDQRPDMSAPKTAVEQTGGLEANQVSLATSKPML